MLRGIIKTSLSFRFLMIIVAGIVAVSSFSQLRKMPLDVLPEFSPPYVEIQTEALGLSAEEVEQMLTVPMEQDLLAGVAWMEVIRSESVPGLSSVLIYFEPGTDLYRARQMVAERLAQSAVGLPHVSKPPTMIQPLSSTSRFMIVGLSSKKLSLIEMSVLARWTIAPRLLGVPGVANVAIWGQRERQLQVLVNPEKLRAQNVSMEQVIETTGNALWVSSLSFLEASSPGTGGFIDTPNQRLGVWHLLPISSPDDLAKVPVEGAETLALKDVAEVVENHQPLIGDGLVNDEPNLLMVIEKLPGTNTLEVTRGIESTLDVMRPGFKDIDFNATLFRPASFIEMALTNLSRALILSAILLVLVLGLFLYGWRTVLIGVVVIPLALLTALGVLYIRGYTLNVMVLAGLVIAFGIIVDELVIDLEHVRRRLRENRQAEKPESSEKVLFEALSESRGSLFSGTLVTLLAIVPVFFIEGTNGAILEPLAMAYTLAVLAALLVALLLTPALCVILLSNPKREEANSPLAGWLQKGYDRFFASGVQKPAVAVLILIILVLVGLAAIPFIRSSQLLPQFQEPYIMIHLEGAPATSRAEMDRIVARVSNELQSIPGVQNSGAHVGRAVFGDQVVGINTAELWVNINPKANYQATIAAIQAAVDGYPGLEHQVQTYLGQTLSQPQTQAGSLVMRVFGEDLQVLETQAENLKNSVSSVQGVKEAYVDLPVREPTLEIEVDMDAAQRFGIKPGEVRRAAATMLSGLPVGSLFEEQKVFDVVVWSLPELRDSLSDVLQMPIQTAGGGYIHLKDVADVRMVDSPTIIRREGVSPYLDVVIGTQGRDAEVVARDLEAAAKNYAFPLEYHAEVLSNFAEERAALLRILTTSLISLAGMLLLLQAAWGNWRLAAVTFLTLPAALAGGVLAASLCGATLSITALLSLLAILGIAVRNSLMLIKHYERLVRVEGGQFTKELVQRGTREQSGPICMTALMTGLGLLPFAVFGNLPGLEVVRPMAIIILGGLVSSTLFSLIVLPALYLWLGTNRETDLGFQSATSAEAVPADD